MPKKDREVATQENRRKRIPLGVHRSKMSVPAGLIPDGHHGHWLNDVDNRLMMAQQGGYDFVENNGRYKIGEDTNDVNSDLGSKVSQIVDREKGTRAYLMVIPQEFYDEDQAAKLKPVDEIDQQIKNGGYKADGLESDKAYGSVKYDSQKYQP
jgi:hypothetical protein